MSNGIIIHSADLSFTSPLKLRESTTHLILHHAYTDGTVEDIHRIHQNQTWSGIGYNFYVRKNGTVWKGRGKEYVGAHCAVDVKTDANPYSVGISFEGDYHNKYISMTTEYPEQFEAGAIIIALVLQWYPSITTICGHRDMMATDCPGDYFPLNEIIQEGRSKVSVAYQAPGVPKSGV